MIEECPANVLCKVLDMVDLPNNEVFIGEIVETYVNKVCVTDDKSDITKINPIYWPGASTASWGVSAVMPSRMAKP